MGSPLVSTNKSHFQPRHVFLYIHAIDSIVLWIIFIAVTRIICFIETMRKKILRRNSRKPIESVIHMYAGCTKNMSLVFIYM